MNDTVQHKLFFIRFSARFLKENLMNIHMTTLENYHCLLALSSGKLRLPRRGMEKLKKRLASLNLSARTVQCLVQEYREQSAPEATAGNVNMSRKRD